MNQPDCCSLPEFARLRGCSESYVRRLRRKGRLVLDEHGSVLVAASNARIAATADPSRPQALAGSAGGDVSRESTFVEGLGVLGRLITSAHDELADLRLRDGAGFDAEPCLVKAWALLDAADHRLAMLQSPSQWRAPAPALFDAGGWAQSATAVARGSPCVPLPARCDRCDNAALPSEQEPRP